MNNTNTGINAFQCVYTLCMYEMCPISLRVCMNMYDLYFLNTMKQFEHRTYCKNNKSSLIPQSECNMVKPMPMSYNVTKIARTFDFNIMLKTRAAELCIMRCVCWFHVKWNSLDEIDVFSLIVFMKRTFELLTKWCVPISNSNYSNDFCGQRSFMMWNKLAAMWCVTNIKPMVRSIWLYNTKMLHLLFRGFVLRAHVQFTVRMPRRHAKQQKQCCQIQYWLMFM